MVRGSLSVKKSEEIYISGDSKGKERGKLARALWVTLGTISLALGIIGIAVPLLPTTPFLLLAAACYCRGSDKMHAWLLNHKWFGNYIREYEEQRAIRKKAKITAITFLWASIILCMILVTDELWLRILLAAIAVMVTAHIMKLKTI